jgi:hypothetical protein
MSRMASFTCAYCQREASQPAGAVNRARKIGASLYCDRKCSGLGRRMHKTKAEKVEEKRLYDAEYRRKNRAMLKAKKAEYFKRTYNPAKAAVERKNRMAAHVEYCRRPEYREWKRGYDRQYRAVKEYGEYAECFLLTQDIRAECLSQQSDYEIRLAKGTLGKAQQRKRDYDRSVRKEPEIGPLGNLELRQGRQNGSLAG